MRWILLFLLAVPVLFSQAPANQLTLEQKEMFLQKASVSRMRGAKKGITGTQQAILSDGQLTHEASIQTINEEKPRFEGEKGIEINFRDTYLFNVAAYRLAKLLGMSDMVPPSVIRSHRGQPAAWTWWVDGVLMDEGERLKKKTTGDDNDKWARQTLIMRIFDQLIANTDRNVGNMIYDDQWHLWLIDHTRAFRLHNKPPNPKLLEKCDRQLLAKMKSLNVETLNAELGSCLRAPEIRALLSRRDAIVAHFEAAGPQKLYDYLSQR